MMYEFKLPDVGEGVAEGEIVSWLVEPGDTVEEDQAVAEVETDKAVVEVPSPVNGSVKEILAEEGELVPVGTVIITFAEAGEETDVEPADSATDSAVEAETETGAKAATEDEKTQTQNGRVFAAPSARRVARELDIDIGGVEGSGPGGRVSETDVRAAAEGKSVGETDESAVEPAVTGVEDDS
ncbi:MAG TPA: biotin/lipoyl-containing protein, partial [Halococcus sp.]|nr:biotin/lipoyl-containing protein [Halococcus sp.]